MRLLPLDTPERLRLAAGWMAQKENARWLDFGDGRRVPTPEWLRIVTQRPADVLRLFTGEGDETPIGIVGLSEVDRGFRTGRIWVVTGDKSWRARGHATRAASLLLTLGFGTLGLHAINTWIVDGNPSARIAERLGFRPIGRQRQCHWIDGQARDRLWFDLLAAEHRER